MGSVPELVDGLDSKSSALGHVGSSPTAPIIAAPDPDNPVMDTYARFPVELVKGKGVWVWDRQGHRYLDCVAGIAVCTLGHSDRRLRRALNRQLGHLQHVSNLYRIPEQQELAAAITARSCFDRVFFCNSGAEANEAAIKLARKHGNLVRGIPDRDGPLILTAQASFHGRTLAAVSATGQPKYHQGFEPMVQGFRYFPYNDTAAFEALLSDCEASGPRVAAVLLEPLQGEGGVHPGERAFFQRVRQLCDAHNILLIFDEVQIGVGRSGELWGYQKLGVEPDGFTLAKGLGGGIPIGALAVKRHCDHFRPGDHASTFGGNPFACRAGLTVLAELERRNLLARVRHLGEVLGQELAALTQRHPEWLEGSRGWGLLQGLVLKPAAPAAPAVVKAALDQGLLVVPAGANVVRFVPPLTIKPRQIRQAVQRLEQALLSLA
jgi:acetylornithine/N-succinyldiaminopimelate aminotransferase